MKISIIDVSVDKDQSPLHLEGSRMQTIFSLVDACGLWLLLYYLGLII